MHLHELYESYKRAGFSDEQSLRLVEVSLKSIMDKSLGNV